MVQAINDQGMIPFLAGVMEPAGEEPHSDFPGDSDPNDGYDEDRYPRYAAAKTFARNLAARLSGNVVILSPGFDDRPTTAQWATTRESVRGLMKEVGAEIARVAPHLLVTNHFGTVDAADVRSLQNEAWLDFQMLQSGARLNAQATPADPDYGDAAEQLKLVTRRARELAFDLVEETPLKAVVNGEAIYDEGEPYEESQNPGRQTYHRNDLRARHAMYLSWLNGSFGHTLGVGGVWDWNLCQQFPTGNHCDSHLRRDTGYDTMVEGITRLSSDAMAAYGGLLRTEGPAVGEEFLTPFEQYRILNQPAEEASKMALGRDPHTLLAYLPGNPWIEIDAGTLAGYPPAHRWIDVRTGGDLPTTGPILRWNGSSYVVDPVYCGSAPQDCIFCDVESTPARCAFLNPAASDPDIEDRDALFVVDLDPGYSAGWAGHGTEILRVWSGHSTTSTSPGIDGEVRTADGELAGARLRVSDDEISSLPSHPAVAGDGLGTFLVAWQDDADADGRFEVHARWVVGDGKGGESTLSKELVLSPRDGLDHVGPSVAIDREGQGLVAWTRKGGDGETLPLRSLVYTFLEQDGDTEVHEIVTPAPVSRWSPQAAARSSDGFALSWVERAGPSESRNLLVQQLDATGGLLGEPQQVNQTDADLLRNLRAYYSASDDLTLEWDVLGGTAGDAVYARSFDGLLRAISLETLVRSYASDPPQNQTPDGGDEPIWKP